MTNSAPFIALLVTALGGLWGCSASDAGECTIGADCPSGVCGEDGRCAAEGDSPDAGELDAPDASPASCTDGIDGTLVASELPLAPGVSAVFRTAQDLSFSTAPTVEDGVNRWDFSGTFSGDEDQELVLLDPAMHWSAELFPGATYMAQLTSDSDLLGVFELSEEGLDLLGVVSPDDGFGRTELEYDPPARLLSLPAQVGSSWQVESSVSGLAQGIVTAYSESYAGEIDSAGVAATPFGEFQVLRSRVELTRTLGFVVTTIQQQSFFAECAGSVASLRSLDDESEAEFNELAELRRLAP